MKKICIFLLIVLVCAGVFCGCKRSVETPADELTLRNWQTKNPSGISAKLEFADDSGKFTIYDSENNPAVVIEGALAIDSKCFMITSDRLCRTFEFGYKVFKDRAEITYDSQTLVFYPVSEDCEE